METKYLEQFTKLVDNPEARALVKLYGNRIVIEALDLEMKTASGLIIQADTNMIKGVQMQKPTVGIVLMTGEGYYDEETGESVPMELEVGNVILVADAGIRFFNAFPGIQGALGKPIGITDESNVHMVFESIEKYKEFEEALNGQTET